MAQNNEIFRVNSLTLAVDDYTASFSAYHNLQFIDIAGRSKDTVFVATGSAEVIQLTNASLKVIDGGQGIAYNVNSIGINCSVTDPHSGRAIYLMIATGEELYFYNMDIGEPVINYFSGTNKIFEAGYRREMYADSSIESNRASDTVDYLPVIPIDAGDMYHGFLWEGGKQFGYNIHTAYFTTKSIYDNDDFVLEMNLFWGNSKGMFQTRYEGSYPANGVYRQYLPSTNINKITGIYNLTSFGNGHLYGDPGLIKENLLVGTDKGFYFSSSVYQHTDAQSLRSVSLFHYDEIGDVVINDICVNAASTQEPICEDGVWLAADNGLYLLKPDYAKYLNGQHLNAINFVGLPDTLSEIEICAGSHIMANVDNKTYSGKTFQWYKDGAELPGANKDTLIITGAGLYYAVLYDPCQNIHIESNYLKVSVISGPVFTFNYPDKIQHCNNDPLVLQTTDNPGYRYRWYTDGMLNGDTTASFTVATTGKYKLEVSACSNSWTPTKEVEVDLINLIIPEITADKLVHCSEEAALLSLNAVPDPSYTINWYRDGIVIISDKNLAAIKDTVAGIYTAQISGNNTDCVTFSSPVQLSFINPPKFLSSFPSALRSCTSVPLEAKLSINALYHYRWYTNGSLNGDTTRTFIATASGKYQVEVSSCDNSWIPSNEVTVDIIQMPAPVVTASKTAYCIGDNALLSESSPVDPTYTIDWLRDNIIMSDYRNKEQLITTIPGVYTVLVTNNLSGSDGSSCQQISLPTQVSFNPVPVIRIERIIKNTLCQGESIDLKVHYTEGHVTWSTGETAGQITVRSSGTYKVSVMSSSGCQVDSSITVNFFSLPVLTMSDTSVCISKNKAITLTAPQGFSSYTWNGVPGVRTFQVNNPQAVTLTVSDANGCQASRQFKVTDGCLDISIPNTFTPNNDGINDTWEIPDLDNDPSVTVKVFTRYGTLVFDSRGYGTPWNGEYHGKKLPPGVYYYLITLKNGRQRLSGSLTIIY